MDNNGRRTLGELVTKQINFEAETLAALVAYALWKSEVLNNRCLLFVDNEGTKFSLLKGASDNQVVDALAGKFAEMEAEIHSFTWLARVPSKSNVADAPSRNGLSSVFFSQSKNLSDSANACLAGMLGMLENGVSGQATSHMDKKRSCPSLVSNGLQHNVACHS